jgi:hypothetical protein
VRLAVTDVAEGRRDRKKRERIARKKRVLANGGYVYGQGAIAEVLGVRPKDIRRVLKRWRSS